MNKLFKANTHALNFDKTNFKKFVTNIKTCIKLKRGYVYDPVQLSQYID